MKDRDDERAAFRKLQSHLGRRWALVDGDDAEPRDIVVVPFRSTVCSTTKSECFSR
jgi:hypothetical protein